MNFWRPIKVKSDLPPIGSRESERLDFKAQGYGKGDQECCEAARDVAQFASQLGGTLLLGAQDENGILKEYVGLSDIADQRTRLRDICAARLDPPIAIDPVEIDYEGRGILAINVPASFSAVGVRITSTPRYEFPIRRSDQKQYLSLHEVVMMGTPERRGFLLLDSIPQGSRNKLRIDAEDLDSLPTRDWRLEEIGSRCVTFKVQDISVYVPLAFVEAVWPSDSYGEYTITIRARFHIDNGRKIEVSRARRW